MFSTSQLPILQHFIFFELTFLLKSLSSPCWWIVRRHTLKKVQGCHDTQHNNTQLNDTQHNDTHHNDTQHNDTQNNDTQYNNTQLNDTQHKETQHSDPQHNDPHNRKMMFCCVSRFCPLRILRRKLTTS
jgi:hypothetical protein